MTADDSPPPKRRRWYRSFSLRALLLLTASVALVLAFIVLPREQRRLAMQSLRDRGVEVELTQDPKDLMLAAVQGQDDWEEPSWTTAWLHRNLPHAYLRLVSAVYFRKPHTPIKEDFQEIGRLGQLHALFFQVPIEHPEHLQPLIASDNVNDYLYFGHHAVNSESLKLFSQLSRVRRIFFDNAVLTPEGLSYLVAMKNLRTVELTNTGCGDEGLVTVARMQQIDHLVLNDRSFTSVGLEQLASLTQLRQLDVHHLDQARTLGFCKALAAMRNLAELSLYDASGNIEFSVVAELPKLERLTYYGSTTDESLGTLSRSKSLRIVDLSNGKITITEAGLKHLLEIPSLEEIIAYCNPLTKEAVQRLKSIRPDVKFHLNDPIE